MRISCASLVRIVTTDGRLALLVNKNGRKQGLTVLAPLGGATEVDATLGRQIMSQLNLTDADFDKPPTDTMDLRFAVDDALVDEVRRSFLSWDSGPEREIREELVDQRGTSRFNSHRQGRGTDDASSHFGLRLVLQGRNDREARSGSAWLRPPSLLRHTGGDRGGTHGIGSGDRNHLKVAAPPLTGFQLVTRFTRSITPSASNGRGRFTYEWVLKFIFFMYTY